CYGGRDLGWPLARDKPVVKLDRLHYLFKLPDKDDVLLNNGVTTLVRVGHDLGWPLARNETMIKLDHLHYLIKLPDKDDMGLKAAPIRHQRRHHGYWNDLWPRVESYNGMLAKAIGAGTNHLIKGIFMCSKAYASPVRTGPA
ncbi:senescence/dehydration-associated protein At4g35985, chloroplastic-like, partial [Triticum aestivum]|uniref:senescence/dehydration-associated protein At4g35985, chloroplastic-like n=1 Tax=Triticum aestivum TaxID=4565 RepID=UPI001D030185